MQFRKFGNTDLVISEIGFGAWAIGGSAMIGETAIGWGDADDRLSKKAVHASLDQGINFFDTADIYGLGHSEKLLGEWIGSRKDIIIASKVGNVARKEKFTVDYSKKHILSACDASLKRLRRDYIDYYQLHSARLEHLNAEECVMAMNQLQEQGKIRYWGLSLNSFDPLPEANLLIERRWGSGFQLVLNLINQRALPIIKEGDSHKYGIIARMPLQFGLLTGKFDKQVSFPVNDHRKNRLTSAIVEQAKKTLQPIWELCKKYHCTKTHLALSYILSYPAVSTIIPGIRSPEQARENSSGLFRLSPEDMGMIEEMGKEEISVLMDAIQALG